MGFGAQAVPAPHAWKVGWREDDGYGKKLTPATAFHSLRGSTRTALLCNGLDNFANARHPVIALGVSPLIGLREAGFPINLTICITPRPLLFQPRKFGREVPRTGLRMNQPPYEEELLLVCCRLPGLVSDHLARATAGA